MGENETKFGFSLGVSLWLLPSGRKMAATVRDDDAAAVVGDCVQIMGKICTHARGEGR